MRILLLGALAIAPFCVPIGAQEHADLAVVSQIKTEAFENSQVMETLEPLTDQYGPRLTVSPQWREAADWAVKRLQSYGLDNVRLEKWGTPGRAWTLKRASLEMLEPRYSALVAAPLAWSDATPGEVTGNIVLAQYGSGRRSLHPKVAEEELDKFEAEWKGKLKGKIVLLSGLRKI
jgi:carboxypeptidase Q